MTVLTDSGKRVGQYIISELEGATGGQYARDRGVLLTGNDGVSGMVVGQVTASKKFTALNTGASDGSQTAAAILYTTVDATGGDQPAVFTKRATEVNGAELIWPAGISAPNKAAAIAALELKGIIVR